MIGRRHLDKFSSTLNLMQLTYVGMGTMRSRASPAEQGIAACTASGVSEG